jgi:hypothetical protein
MHPDDNGPSAAHFPSQPKVVVQAKVQSKLKQKISESKMLEMLDHELEDQTYSMEHEDAASMTDHHSIKNNMRGLPWISHRYPSKTVKDNQAEDDEDDINHDKEEQELVCDSTMITLDAATRQAHADEVYMYTV